jgi:hypothetical protein
MRYRDIKTLLADVVFYAPIGLVTKYTDNVSTKISQKSQELTSSGNSAKLIGQFAVIAAKRKTGKIISSVTLPPSQVETIVPETPKTSTTEIANSNTLSDDVVALAEQNDAGIANKKNATLESDLPIRGYDTLAASQIIKKLSSLERNELQTLYDYELHKRARRTIIARIDHLLQSLNQGDL